MMGLFIEQETTKSRVRELGETESREIIRDSNERRSLVVRIKMMFLSVTLMPIPES